MPPCYWQGPLARARLWRAPPPSSRLPDRHGPAREKFRRRSVQVLSSSVSLPSPMCTSYSARASRAHRAGPAKTSWPQGSQQEPPAARGESGKRHHRCHSVNGGLYCQKEGDGTHPEPRARPLMVPNRPPIREGWCAGYMSLSEREQRILAEIERDLTVPGSLGCRAAWRMRLPFRSRLVPSAAGRGTDLGFSHTGVPSLRRR